MVAFFIPKFCRGGRKSADRRGSDPRDKSVAEKGIPMKREFLQNLKVGEEALPKEVIDAIMEENGRDVTAAKVAAVKPYADYDDIKRERDDLKAKQGDGMVDGKSAQQWKDAHDQAVADHQKELAGVKFQSVLDNSITAAKGKSAKAITALLDLDALRDSEDQQVAITAALEELKKDSGYLFDTEGTPPPYARGTGTGNPPPAAPETLAGALRERYDK